MRFTIKNRIFYGGLGEGVDVDDGEDHEEGEDGEGELEVFLKFATEDNGVEGALLETGGAVFVVVVVMVMMRRRIRIWHLMFFWGETN